MEHTMLTSQAAKKASIDELFQRLSSSENAFSPSEAEGRPQQYNYNEIAGKKINSMLKLLSYFWGPIPGMIEVAAILSAVVHHWEDFWIICVRFFRESNVKTLIWAAYEQKHYTA
jgi:H+-transporting ATPase